MRSLARPPLERAEMAPREEAQARGGEDRLGRDVAADAGESVGPRVRCCRIGDARAAAGHVGRGQGQQNGAGRARAWDGRRRRRPASSGAACRRPISRKQLGLRVGLRGSVLA